MFYIRVFHSSIDAWRVADSHKTFFVTVSSVWDVALAAQVLSASKKSSTISVADAVAIAVVSHLSIIHKIMQLEVLNSLWTTSKIRQYFFSWAGITKRPERSNPRQSTVLF